MAERSPRLVAVCSHAELRTARGAGQHLGQYRPGKMDHTALLSLIGHPGAQPLCVERCPSLGHRCHISARRLCSFPDVNCRAITGEALFFNVGGVLRKSAEW